MRSESGRGKELSPREKMKLDLGKFGGTKGNSPSDQHPTTV